MEKVRTIHAHVETDSARLLANLESLVPYLELFRGRVSSLRVKCKRPWNKKVVLCPVEVEILGVQTEGG